MGSQHQNMLHRISPNAVWRHTVGLMSRDSLLNAPNTETQGEAETGLASCRGRPNHES